MDRGPFRELEAASVFVRLVGYDGEMADAFRADLRRDLLHRQCAFGRLAPRHRDRVIVGALVGHVAAGGDGKADRQRARMRIGAVTQVLEEVVARRKWRLPNPLRALATHGGETCRLPVHPDRHQVAADTRAGNGALRNTRRGVVRATGAEIGNTLCQILRVGEHSLELPQPCNMGSNLFRMSDDAKDALTDRDRNFVRIKRALHREQRLAVLVLLADDDRVIGRAVEVFAQLHFQQRAFLFNHDHRLQAAYKLGHVLVVERPGTCDLEEAKAQLSGTRFIDAEIIKGLAHIEIACAYGDDAKFGAAATRVDDAVEAVLLDEGSGSLALVVVEPFFLTKLVQFVADMEATWRQLDLRQADPDAVESHVNRGGGFDIILHAFQCGPGAGKTRQRVAVNAIVDQFLHTGRVKDRDHRVNERELAGVGD